MVTIPSQLAENIVHWHGPAGERWLDSLPALVGDLERRWHVRADEPYGDGGAVSWVAPVTLSGGSQAVLKVFLPDLENEQEPEALEHYAGRGAARALRAEPGAILLERLVPGTPLWDVEDDDEACRIAAAVLRELWQRPRAGHRFRPLAQDAARWATEIPATCEAAGRPYEPELAALAGRLAGELATAQGEQVVLHQDLHGGNILRAERRPWLAIDPKPLVGERAFDCAALVRDRRSELMADPHPLGRIRQRLDQLSEELELDRERIRGWAVVHAVAWGGEGGPGWDPAMVACANWLAEA
jgi:streptomycin 6-kinase